MPLVLADRVNETTTTTSTGTITLAGAVSGYQSFAVIGNGNTTYYTIVHQTANEWEVGIGTYTSSGTTLSRDTVLASSNSGSLVNFSAGTKFVFCDYPAGRAVYLDTATNVTIPGLTLSGGTANGVLYLNGSKVATSGSALTFDGTTVLTTPRINVTNTGTGATFSSSGGSGMRLYGSSGTNQWDVYLNGTNIRFSDNTGGGVVKIDTGAVIDGNLGIGTASPGTKLEVTGDITQTWAASMDRFVGSKFSTTYELGLHFIESTRETRIVSKAADSTGLISFYTGVTPTQRAVIDSSGRFLLGASSNTSRGGSNTTALFYKASGTQYLDIQTGTSGDSGIVFSATSSSAYGLINYSNSVNAMLFYANSAEVFRITSSGLLGLGTTSPAAKLHVVNSTPNSGRQTLFLDSSYGNAGDSAASIRATLNNNAGGTYIWGLTSESVLAHNMEFISGSNWVARSTTASYLSQAGGEFVFYSNQSLTAGNTFTPTERMRLNTSGNLGIGTASPGTRLDVQSSTTGTRNARFIDNSGVGGGGRGSGIGLGGISNDTGPVISEYARLIGLKTNATQGNSQGYLSIQTNDGSTLVERAVINSSGNLGIGTTSPGCRLQVTQAASAALGAQIALHNNASSAVGNAVEIALLTDGGASPSGTRNARIRAVNENVGNGAANMQFWTWNGGTDAERMRLNSTGLGISEGNAPTQVLSLYRSGSTNAIMSAGNSNTGLDGTWFGVDTVGNGIVNVRGAFPLLFSTSALERARITSGGKLLVGTTTAGYGLFTAQRVTINPDNDGIVVAPLAQNLSAYTVQANNDTGTRYALYIANGSSTAVGTISFTSAATAYNTSSDRRLKDNIAPADDAGSVIDAIEVVKHDWKVGGHTRYGMIAQDLHMVAPEAVSVGDADDVEDFKNPWGVDYSKLVPMLVKEIQSLRQRVAQLEVK